MNIKFRLIVLCLGAIVLTACNFASDDTLTYKPYSYSNAYFKQNYNSLADYNSAWRDGFLINNRN